MVYVYIYAFDFRKSNNFKTLNRLLLKSQSLIVAFYWNKCVLVVNLVVSVECGILGTRIPIKKTWEGYHRMPHKDSGFDSFLEL